MSKIAVQLKNSTDDSSIYPITDSRIVYHGDERLSGIVEDTSTHISAIDSSVAGLNTRIDNIDSSISGIDSSIAILFEYQRTIENGWICGKHIIFNDDHTISWSDE
jgi:hypothetical protein